MRRCAVFFTVLAFALTAANAAAQTTVLKDPAKGNPELKSIQAMSFAPGGVMLIGDGKGKQVVAIETGDTTAATWTGTEVKDIKGTLAGKIGAMGKDIEIIKVAVNPASRTAYFAIRALAMKRDMILTMDGAGKVGEFKMDNVSFVSVPLPGDQKVTAITDVTWAGDRVLVAAQASDTFGSKILSIMGPLAKGGACSCFSTETYHVAHKKWETKAPIRTVIPFEMDGKKYLVGAFTCTPIVKYALDDLQAGGKVKGVSVIELGQGNTPTSMFAYEKAGKKYILMCHIRFMHANNPVGPSEYWTARVDMDILKEADKVNEKALLRTKGKASESQTDLATIMPTFHGVMMMDRLDADRALVIRKDAKGGVNLEVLTLP